MVSVVIPFYNVEPYIKECLTSVVNQTYHNLEIICVDDGSTNSSSVICDEYALKDSRIVVIHKENAGMGVSYNIGIDSAKGEYIGFLESDDFTQANMYEDLYLLAEKHKADITKSAWFRYYTSAHKAEKDFQMCEFNSWQRLSVKEVPELLGKQCTVWSAIYKTDFIRNKNGRIQIS